MSGGQQQRVAIARAIVGDRRLVLADEPTGALDTETGEQVLRLLRTRCDAGAAGVLVTHEARHAAWADRVVFLRDGLVVDQTGPAPSAESLLARRRRSMMRLLRGWRPALRIARREALRARGRSVLVLVMIGLPVLAVVALDTLGRTSTVSAVEGLTRQLGAADAAGVVVRERGAGRPDTGHVVGRVGSTASTASSRPPRPRPRRCVGARRRRRVVERVTGRVAVRTDVGLARPTAIGLDLQRPDDPRAVRPARRPLPPWRRRGRRQRSTGRARLPGRLDPDPGRRHSPSGRRHRGVDDHPRTEHWSSVGGRAGPRLGCRDVERGGRLAGLTAGRRRLGRPSAR